MTAIQMVGPRLAFVALALFAGSEVFGQAAVAPVSAFSPYVNETFEYNSNVFALPNSAAAVAFNGDPQLSDKDLKTVLGFTETYNFDREQLYMKLEARHVNYDHFTDLDHYEYFGTAGLNWKLLSEFSGTLEASLQKQMAPFEVRDTGTQLSIDVDRNIIANAKYQVAPQWVLEGGVDFHNEKAPVLNFADYTLTESIGHFAVKYVGFAYLTYGLLATYSTGKYQNAPVTDASYIERDIDFTLAYRASSLSSFQGEVGRTQRDLGDNQGELSAVTGKLGYTRTTGKTILSVQFTRDAHDYIGAGGSELDTLGMVSVTYQATYRTGFTVSAQDLGQKFFGQTLPQNFSVGRKDKTPSATFRLNWQATRWVLVQPYASYVHRTSNLDAFEYTGTIAGVELVVKRPVAATYPGR
jgi:hypothetical protein